MGNLYFLQKEKRLTCHTTTHTPPTLLTLTPDMDTEVTTTTHTTADTTITHTPDTMTTHTTVDTTHTTTTQSHTELRLFPLQSPRLSLPKPQSELSQSMTQSMTQPTGDPDTSTTHTPTDTHTTHHTDTTHHTTDITTGEVFESL